MLNHPPFCFSESGNVHDMKDQNRLPKAKCLISILHIKVSMFMQNLAKSYKIYSISFLLHFVDEFTEDGE